MKKRSKRDKQSKKGTAVEGKDADSVHNMTDLTAAVADRRPIVKIAPDFSGWDDQAGAVDVHPYYKYLPCEDGIFQCEQVLHPGAQVLNDDISRTLCDLVLGGSRLEFELNPEQQSAVRYCELFISTLVHTIEDRKAIHLPGAVDMIWRTDWAVRDGIGPTTLASPCVIGYTNAKNLERVGLNQPAVIWSCRWQLSKDPLDATISGLKNLVGEIIGKGTESDLEKAALLAAQKVQEFKKAEQSAREAANKKKTAECLELAIKKEQETTERWVQEKEKQRKRAEGLVLEIVRKLEYEIDAKNAITPGIMETLGHKIIQELKSTLQSLGSFCIDLINDELGRQIAADDNKRFREAIARVRFPAESMFKQAERSFPPDHILAKDCWGHPVAFAWPFGDGVIRVQPAGYRDDGAEAETQAPQSQKTVKQTDTENNAIPKPVKISAECNKVTLGNGSTVNMTPTEQTFLQWFKKHRENPDKLDVSDVAKAVGRSPTRNCFLARVFERHKEVRDAVFESIPLARKQVFRIRSDVIFG